MVIFRSDVSLREGTTHLPIGSGGGEYDQVVNMWNPISIIVRPQLIDMQTNQLFFTFLYHIT